MLKMVIPFNMTESIGIIIGTATTTTTGSMFITLLIVMIIFFCFAIMFGIPLEYASILILPLLLAYMAFYKEFVGVGLVIMIYLALVFAKKSIFK